MKQVSSLGVGKGFKKTEIGELPADWEVAKLGDICEVVGGGTPSTQKKEYWNGEIPWATPTDITSLKTNKIESTEKTITKEGLSNSAAKLLPAGSILLTSRATIGECAINTVPMATNQGFTNLLCKKAKSLYIFYYLRSAKHELVRLASGSTFKEISKKSIRYLAIPLPPFGEQNRIGAVLSVVDDAYHKLSEIIEKTKLMKKGMMRRLLTLGIGHTKHNNTDIGKVPADWQIVSLKDIASKSRYSFVDGPFGSNLKTIHYVCKGIPVIQSQSIISGKFIPDNEYFVTESKASELERSLVFPGDIVIAKIGMNYGASATIPNGYPKSILSGNTMKITPNLERIELEYLQHELHYLRQIKEFDRIVSITAQPAITLKDVKRMKMALPPLDEQHRISNILSSCDEEFTQALKYRAKLGELKKALMNVLLTGKVRVQV